jgi:hypothetical protein
MFESIKQLISPHSVFYGEPPINLYILGPIESIFLILTVVAGTLGLKSNQRKLAIQGIVIAISSVALSTIIPFCLLIFLMMDVNG